MPDTCYVCGAPMRRVGCRIDATVSAERLAVARLRLAQIEQTTGPQGNPLLTDDAAAWRQVWAWAVEALEALEKAS